MNPPEKAFCIVRRNSWDMYPTMTCFYTLTHIYDANLNNEIHDKHSERFNIIIQGQRERKDRTIAKQETQRQLLQKRIQYV